MIHAFDKDLATKYGLLEAILLAHFEYWTEKNKANDSNFYDGYYWTYNSIKAFAEMFPYASSKQIKNALSKLIAEGFVITGNYNQHTYDRTLWYALTEKGKCIMQKGKMDLPAGENAFAQMEQPIPNSNQINNADIKENYTSIVKEKHPTIEEVKAYCKERANGVDAERWYNYYSANGWKVGKNPMKDWKAAVRTWERNGVGANTKLPTAPENSFDVNEFFERSIRRNERE